MEKCVVFLDIIQKLVDSYFASVPRFKPRKKEIDKALLIAHRGAHNNAKGIIENTNAAFSLAKKVGCWGIELDVHSTSDGVLVVNHDPNLKRLWGHNEKIADLNFNKLRALVPSIPSLAEVVLQYGKDMHLFIELKTMLHNDNSLFDDLKSLLPVEDYHIITLTPPFFNSLKHFPKESLLLVAGHNNVKEFCDLSLKSQYGGVLGSYVLLTEQRIKQLKDSKQIYGVGLVDSKNNLYRELKRGIHFIFTNRAVVISRHLQQLQKNTK